MNTWVDKIFPPKKLVLPNGKTVWQRRSRTPLVILILLAGIVWSVELTGFDLQLLLSRWREFLIIIEQMVPPNWAYMPKLWGALFDTIKMSLLGSLLGSVAAIPAAVLAAANIYRNRWLSALIKTVLSILRTLPTLVTALIATFIFGLGPFAGTVAIFLFTFAYVGKMFYEQIESTEMGAFEAMESIGHNKLQAFRHAIMPQVLPVYLSTALYCFEGNVRYAAILGYVGAGGIGFLLDDNLKWRDYANAGVILLALIITVYVIERTSEYFRRKLT